DQAGDVARRDVLHREPGDVGGDPYAAVALIDEGEMREGQVIGARHQAYALAAEFTLRIVRFAPVADDLGGRLAAIRGRARDAHRRAPGAADMDVDRSLVVGAGVRAKTDRAARPRLAYHSGEIAERGGVRPVASARVAAA